MAQTSDSDMVAYPRLLTRIATVLGALCVSAQERLLQSELPRLLDELDRQILPDGGYVSRHPGLIVEILLDLLPLRTCFAARDVPVPDRFQAAIDRMLPMLRFMRLGDGSIARFNGMGGTAPDRLAAVLAYDEKRAVELEVATHSRYVRMQRRQSTLLIDAGAPPALEHTSDSHAGCLSFEMSAGRFPLIVCCGAPGLADQDWRIQARATASQSTLVLADQASAQLVRSGAVFERIGVPLLDGPLQVHAEAGPAEDGAAEFRGSHDGYVARFGLLHTRVLRLTPQGDRLDGVDRLVKPGNQSGRPAARQSAGKPLPFALHFHIHPSAKVTRSRDAGAGEVTLLNGEDWRLSVQGADLGLEESVYLAHLSGPMRSIQLVARGIASGETEIRWRLERVKAGETRFRRPVTPE
jgi:uncharacterized heparinase superfamily protein